MCNGYLNPLKSKHRKEVQQFYRCLTQWHEIGVTWVWKAQRTSGSAKTSVTASAWLQLPKNLLFQGKKSQESFNKYNTRIQEFYLFFWSIKGSNPRILMAPSSVGHLEQEYTLRNVILFFRKPGKNWISYPVWFLQLHSSCGLSRKFPT